MTLIWLQNNPSLILFKLIMSWGGGMFLFCLAFVPIVEAFKLDLILIVCFLFF